MTGLPLYEEMTARKMPCGKNSAQCVSQHVQGEGPPNTRGSSRPVDLKGLCAPISLGCGNKDFSPKQWGRAVVSMCVQNLNTIRLYCDVRLSVARMTSVQQKDASAKS